MHGEAKGGETSGWFWSPLEEEKKDRPEKEKGSSRLELLEWLRREMLP